MEMSNVSGCNFKGGGMKLLHCSSVPALEVFMLFRTGLV